MINIMTITINNFFIISQRLVIILLLFNQK
jgi:hypothetical protein